ncbi:MAG: NAD(+) synthase [Euryarchaeota archaeon]|nr:NAD(+) synthase [Euryarchaeota archaeon]
MTPDHNTSPAHSDIFDPSYHISQICTLIKDTHVKSGASGYVVGISGGIDSAVVAALITRAIGTKQIIGLFLPSPTTPKADYDDVDLLSTWLGISTQMFSLEPVLAGYQGILAGDEKARGNLTSRVRMNILYLYANENRLLVSGTSNKTEWYTGYFTKYGDNAADIQPIIHLFKDEVYALAEYLQIPSVFIEKDPSAGLYEGQTDEADLQMTYTVLDRAFRSLEKHNWVAQNDEEVQALKLYNAASHKRTFPPHISFTNRPLSSS